MSKEKKRQAKNKKNAQKPAARKDAALLEADRSEKKYHRHSADYAGNGADYPDRG